MIYDRRYYFWEYLFESEGTFGVLDYPREMIVSTPTDDEDYIRLTGMICSFAMTARENGIPLGALRVRGKRLQEEE